MIKDSNFGPFLRETRTNKKVTLEQLCDGLCTASTLCRIENEKREAERHKKNNLDVSFLKRQSKESKSEYANFINPFLHFA